MKCKYLQYVITNLIQTKRKNYKQIAKTLEPCQAQIQELVNFVAINNLQIHHSLKISAQDVIVGFLLYLASLKDFWASFSKMSLMKLFMMPMALLEIPKAGWTCFSTLKM